MEQIYRKWRDGLNNPDDSIFYYHPSLERIVLGLAMYEIASRPYLRKLGKAKSLTLYNMYINEMVTAWIYDSDEYKESFGYTFHSLMTLSQTFFIVSNALMQQQPALKKVLRQLQYTFGFWPAIGGDIKDELAEELLDDITTDGKRIESEKIERIVKRVQPEVISKGLDLNPIEALDLIESIDTGNQNNNSVDSLAELYESDKFKSGLDNWRDFAIKSMDDYDDIPEKFKEMVKELSTQEMLREYGFDFQKPALAKDAYIEFLPALSYYTDMVFPEGQTWYHRVLTETVVLQVEKLGKGDNVQYMNLYFLRMGRDRIKIAACLGDVINYVYGRNILGAQVLELLPESAKRNYPYLYRHINERTSEDMKKAYLNTISFNKQPKQWFVMKDIVDKGAKLWQETLVRGPYNERFKEPVMEVVGVIAKIYEDLHRPGNEKVLPHLNLYMEKGESVCELVKYTPSTF